jgi:two-component system cell cycle sensor histidine kinase/response regulator CckA
MSSHKLKRAKKTKYVTHGNLLPDFKRIERREWWLWSTVVVVTLLLTLAIASFILPALRHDDAFSQIHLPQAVRGLLGLVLLFDIYTVYQQLQIHRIRRQLIEREEVFRLISENAADMIAVVGVDGRRIYNSLSYEKVLGYTAEELGGSSAFEQIHPDDRERVKKAGADALATGVGQTLEYRILHKDQTWRMLESTASVIHNPKGPPEKLVIVNRDVTKRKQAEEALRQSESSFGALFQGAPYGIYRTRIAGQLLQVNPALRKMLGYESESELLQANLATDIYRDPAEYHRLNQLLLGVEDFKDVENDWKRKDGTPLKVRCSGRAVRNENGVVDCLDVFAEDITERRVLERQLHMAQKMEAIGRLSGGIAHDFNNLLGVVIGYSQVLKKSLGPSSPLFEHATEIEKAGQRATTLTRQLLAFSRQQVLEPAILNLNALVSDTEKMLRRLIGEDIELTTALDPGLGQVKADHGQIEQVVMNLAVNSRDAMVQGGKLTIKTANVQLNEDYVRHHPGSRVGRYVMLAVSDTGTGMDAETQAHIFEPFFTTKERGKGTGLGLATVYGVVKQSDGYISVDSKIGVGTSFEIYLLRVDEPLATNQPSTAPVETLRGSEIILLVEDAEPLLKLARMFLESNGYQVMTATNGADAIQAAQNYHGPIDLLLTDVVMPGMNGRALAKYLAALQPKMKVLYMSGYTDSAIADHGVLEAGTYLLRKPFTEDALTQKVREVLDAGRGSKAVQSSGWVLDETPAILKR